MPACRQAGNDVILSKVEGLRLLRRQKAPPFMAGMSFFAQMFSRLSYAGLSAEVKRESSLTKADEWFSGSEFRPPKERRNYTEKKPRDLSRGVFTIRVSNYCPVDSISSMTLSPTPFSFR